MMIDQKQDLAHLLYERMRVPIFRFGLVFQLIVLGVTAFFIRPSSDTFILSYNAFFGVDVLGAWWQVYLVPGIVLIFFLCNVLLAQLLARRQMHLAAVGFLCGAALVVLSGVVALSALVLINT